MNIAFPNSFNDPIHPSKGVSTSKLSQFSTANQLTANQSIGFIIFPINDGSIALGN